MNQAIKDPLLNLAISCQFNQPPAIPDEMLSYLEEVLLDEAPADLEIAQPRARSARFD